MRNPHVTGRVFLYQDTLTFPLRAAYEKAMAEATPVVSETSPVDDDVAPPPHEAPSVMPPPAIDVSDAEGIYRGGTGKLYKKG